MPITRRAVTLRHVAFEDLDVLEPLLCAAGFENTYIDTPTGTPFGDAALNADLLVVLGGPMGVYETESYPFLTEEIAVIRCRLMAKQPVLGICLGAQLMAAALDARIYPGSNGKEIGWAPVALTPAGQESPLGALANQQPVLHWHGDTFDLPPGAQLLAKSAQYEQQAFSVGTYGLALQFHLEAGAEGLERWYVGHAGELAQEGVDMCQLRRQSRRYAGPANEALKAVLATFFQRNFPDDMPS